VPATRVSTVQTEARRDRAGSSRLGLVTSLLGDALATLTPADGVLRVLDCGGGSGTYAVPLAVAGADVTVVDISADALATLRRRAEEAGVSASVHDIAGDVEGVAGLVGDQRFDAVLAHGVLDAVDRVGDTFQAMAELVVPGGLLSVLVGNPVASVIARALAGEPSAALAELRRLGDSDGVGPDTVEQLARAAGLTVLARHGIGVFSDLVPGSAGDAAGGRDALAALDAEAADRSPFAELAGRVHLVLRRASG
jgi:S-adenosylmethionine-dependent methyltransferase